jgi:hypothetical protein
VVTIDLIANLPRIVKKHDSIMVVVEKLTKEAHLIHVKKHTRKQILQKFT